MKRRHGLIAGILLAFFLFSTAFAANVARDWVGLWRIIQKNENSATTIFLFVPGGQAEAFLYSEAWEPLALSGLKIDGDRIQFNWSIKGFSQAFVGSRTGSRIQGTWELVHPQYSQKSVFDGVRVHDRPDWTPTGAYSKRGALIDLATPLFDNPAEAERLWKSQFLVDYYAILGDSDPWPAIAAVVSDPANRLKVETFLKTHKEFLKILDQKLPGFELPGRFVIAPVGDAKPKLATASSEGFILVNAVKAGESAGAAGLRSWAEAVIGLTATEAYSHFRGIGVDLAQEGMPLYLAHKLGLAKDMGDALSLDEAKITEFQQKLGDFKSQLKQKKKLPAEARRFMAYDWISALARNHPPQKMLGLANAELQTAFDEYLKKP